MDWSLPGSSVPGILQARTLEWAAISSWENRANVKHATQEKEKFLERETQDQAHLCPMIVWL